MHFFSSRRRTDLGLSFWSRKQDTQHRNYTNNNNSSSEHGSSQCRDSVRTERLDSLGLSSLKMKMRRNKQQPATTPSPLCFRIPAGSRRPRHFRTKDTPNCLQPEASRYGAKVVHGSFPRQNLAWVSFSGSLRANFWSWNSEFLLLVFLCLSACFCGLSGSVVGGCSHLAYRDLKH